MYMYIFLNFKTKAISTSHLEIWRNPGHRSDEKLIQTDYPWQLEQDWDPDFSGLEHGSRFH